MRSRPLTPLSRRNRVGPSVARFGVVVGTTLVLMSWTARSHAAFVAIGMILNPAAPGCSSCTLSGNNTWELVVRDDNSVDDIPGVPVSENSGIAAFSIPVLNVLTVFNRSPRTIVDPDVSAAPAGFTLGRSANNQTAITNGYLITGAQDTLTPTQYLIPGFGLETSSFQANLPGHTFGSPSTQTDWHALLVLAEGTMAAGQSPLIDFSSTQLFIHVLPSVPEPSSLFLAMLGTAAAYIWKRSGMLN